MYVSVYVYIIVYVYMYNTHSLTPCAAYVVLSTSLTHPHALSTL